jgi:pimeloyl-ACP methyl ester carboxylesterase
MAIQSTTRDPATLIRAPLKKGESSPWLDIVRKNVPVARIEVVPEVGHFTQLEAPDEVNRLIRDFVEHNCRKRGGAL